MLCARTIFEYGFLFVISYSAVRLSAALAIQSRKIGDVANHPRKLQAYFWRWLSATNSLRTPSVARTEDLPIADGRSASQCVEDMMDYGASGQMPPENQIPEAAAAKKLVSASKETNKIPTSRCVFERPRKRGDQEAKVKVRLVRAFVTNLSRKIAETTHRSGKRNGLTRRSFCKSNRPQANSKTSSEDPPAIPRPEELAKDKTCNICCSTGTEVQIPASKVTKNCLANRSVCKKCMERHIREAIGKGQYSQVCCICNHGCKEYLGHSDMKRYADKKTFEAYDTGLLRSAIQRNPEFCWCARPGCGSGQLHIDKDHYPIMRCHACRARTCFTHKCEWHEGRTCAQYDIDATKSDEVALLQMLESGIFKRCPKCKIGIEKKGGCDHMTCRRERGGCGEEFCWLCLAPYNGPDGIRAVGNTAHARTCQHYA